MAWLSRLLAAATVLLLLAGMVVTPWRHLEPDPGHTGAWCAQLATALMFGFVGAVVGERVRQPADRIGWILQLTALTQAADLAAGAWGRQDHGFGAGVARWLDGWVWAVGVIPTITLLLFVFPTGEPLPGRWRRAVPAVVGVGAAFVVAQAVAEWPGRSGGVILAVLTGAVVASSIGGVASLTVRFRREDRAGRAQIKWVVWALVVALAWEPLQAVLPRPVAAVGLAVLPLLVPVAIGAAVTRFRLYDVDLVISRTVLYAVLTAVLGGGYLLVALAFGARADQSLDRGPVAAVLVVALVALPLHRILQRTLDRWLLGDRSAHVAVGRLTHRLQNALVADEVPDVVVRTVIDALRVPYAKLEIGSPDRESLISVEQGKPGVTVALPLTYSGRALGTLTVGQRTPRDAFDATELRLLRTLTDAAAPALDGLLLLVELRDARQRTVLAREQERHRLHRDLHDGLGPTLAGITLGLDAVHNFIAQEENERAAHSVERLRQLAALATDDVRTIVDGLRPAALDELGLVAAIYRHAETAAAGLQVHIQVDGDLTELADAVEVATLHITLEAITNVRRHAHARNCWIRLARVGDQLSVEIDDDGIGPTTSPNRIGVGLNSMRERVAELGGRSAWGASPQGGVAVRATLPLVSVP